MTTRASRLRKCALAVCGALVAWATPASADQLVPAVGVQTGVTFTRTPGADTDDYFVAATPSLSYILEADRVVIGADYAFTGSLNTVLPNSVANRLSLALTYDAGRTTRLVFGVEALQALIGNYLLVRRAPQTQIGGLPPLNTSLLTVTASQGLAHDVSDVTRLTQNLSATYVTSLDPDVELNNQLVTSTVGMDRAWEFDAVGGELALQYARTRFPPIDATTMTAQLGPTWDHDFSPTLSSSLNASVQVALSPEPNSQPRIGPAGRASLLYSSEGSGIGADYVGGIQPNLLVGTLLNSHQATLRGFTPLSRNYNVVLGLSGGYLYAKTVDLQGSAGLDTEFDAVLHDAEVTWGVTDYLQLMLRYQFIGQSSGSGPAANPAIVRHAAIFGIDLFGAKRINRRRVNTRFPQRVDRQDGASVLETAVP